MGRDNHRVLLLASPWAKYAWVDGAIDAHRRYCLGDGQVQWPAIDAQHELRLLEHGGQLPNRHARQHGGTRCGRPCNLF